MTPELIQKLNEKIDLILTDYPEGVTHRTRGEVIGKLKKALTSLGIKGDSWLAEIFKTRKL